MKAWKNTIMPAIERSRKLELSPSDFKVFMFVVEILSEYSKSFEVRQDKYRYELWTTHPYRTVSFKPKIKRGVLFAGVAAHSNHIGFYFYPLHISDELKKSVPHQIGSMLRGNSTFHIDLISDEIKVDLKLLITIGLKFYAEKGWIKI